MSRSTFKAVLIVLFDIQVIVMAEWVPTGQTVNYQYYSKVLTKLRLHLLPKSQVSAQMSPFCVGRTCESKNGVDPQQTYRP